jgi:hypothetical protein
MSLSTSAIQRMTLGLHSLEHYEPLIGAAEGKPIVFAR